ncbi:hypothetical protein GW17_00057601 [Ensete ventricosum]|nr:hypothetical protein GW17_00057601 [Ensete ventricosum]
MITLVSSDYLLLLLSSARLGRFRRRWRSFVLLRRLQNQEDIEITLIGGTIELPSKNRDPNYHPAVEVQGSFQSKKGTTPPPSVAATRGALGTRRINGRLER